MKLKKAIELIHAEIDDDTLDWESPIGEAYHLAFEALKREQSNRDNPDWVMVGPLPGETANDPTDRMIADRDSGID